MKTVQLTGHLLDYCKPEYKLDVATPAEAIRLLCVQITGLEDALREGSYRITKFYKDRAHALDIEELGLNFGRADGFKIEPVLAGAKNQGLGKVLLGIAVVGAAFFFSGGTVAGLAGTAFNVAGMGVTYGQIALVGGLIALSGVAAMLSPGVDQEDNKEEPKSFLFEGPRNVVQQGHPIALVYGRMHVGSIVVSTGISTEEI